MAARAAILAEKARRSGSNSFANFVKQAWPYVPSVDPLVWNWHMDAMCLHLEEVGHGRIPALAMNVPPGFGKSVLLSVLWPAWIWTWWPRCQFLFGSYAADLATRDSWRCRAVIESEWYADTHSGPAGWGLRADQNAKGYFVNTVGGERYSTGVGGTGRRAHRIGIDDPLDADDRFSKAARDKANDWIGQTLSQRYVDQRSGAIALIMQRLHVDDPTGYVLRGGGWEHFRLPQEFEPDDRCVTFHYVDAAPEAGPVRRERVELWRDPRTEAGELLFPDRVPREVVEEMKWQNKLGPEGFATQQQQRPMPATGNLFHLSDWRFWKPDGEAPDHLAARPRGCYEGPANPAPRQWDTILVSVDGTFKKTERGSFVAIHVWGASGARRCLLDRVHARMDYDECERALVGDRSFGTHRPLGGVLGRWPDYRQCVVEDKANGSMLVNRLTEVLGVSRVIGVSPGTDDKEKRASVYSLPYHRAGNVELPDGAPWLGEYIGEHAVFPLGKTNDDVDAQSQALQHLEAPLTTAELYQRTQW